MFMKSENLLVNHRKFQPHFNNVSQSIVHEPCQERQCTDVFCLIVLFVALGSFFTIGAIQISNYKNFVYHENLGISASEQAKMLFSEHLPTIAVGIGMALIVAYLYVFLIKSFPRRMIYFMLILSLVIIIVIAIAGSLTNNIGITINFGIIFLVYVVALFCLRSKINTGIALVTVATHFISQKPSIFITPMFQIILTLLISTFGSISICTSAIIMNEKQRLGKDPEQEVAFIYLTSLSLLFFLFLSYNMMTYSISFVCANWYYGIKGSKGSMLTAYKCMFKQMGSLVFGATIIAVATFVRIVRMTVSGKRKQSKNTAVAVCRCLISWLFRCVEQVIKVLNHYTVITISITGENYISGAKSAMGLLWKELGLMSITNIICGFLGWWGLILTIGIPMIVTFLIMDATYDNKDDIGPIIGIVVVCSLLIGTVIFEIIVESVSCIFIYFAIDKNFIERGLIAIPRIKTQNYDVINRYSTNPCLTEEQPNNNKYARMIN